MCYAIPGRIIELKGEIAIVDYFGEQRKAINEVQTVKTGDYVYAQGGIIVDKIPEKEAVQILEQWKELFFQLKKKDDELSGEIKTVSISEAEALQLLKTNDKLDWLFRTANKIRQEHLKNSCCVHGIIEFSNYCRNNCAYCGIRSDNKNLQKYRMNINEIVTTADYAVNQLGFKALVLQSGEDMWYTTEKLVEIIRKIKEKCGVLLFMSVGSRELDCYKSMYESGARGILLRFETSNPELYAKIHSGPKENFKYRIKLLKYARKLGYVIATGAMIGLPGQTEEDLLNDIMLTRSLGAEMYSFGPLIPHPDTPLANTFRVDINRALKVIAISRLMDPEAKILVTTALETLNSEGRKLGLLAGANSLMINITPAKYKQKYLIYPGRPDKEAIQDIKETLNLLYSLGRAPTDLGTSTHKRGHY